MATSEQKTRINQKFNMLRVRVQDLKSASMFEKAAMAELALDNAVALLGEFVQLINESEKNGE